MNETQEMSLDPSNEKKQPAWKPGRQLARPKYFEGAKRSQVRLTQLGFDPIGELVKQYRKIELELEYQEKLRTGEVVELTSTGKVKAYRADIHHGIYDKLTAIADRLLRYGYGRVPETTVVEEKKPMPLVVNLTKKGDVYTVNASADLTDEAEDDYDEESDPERSGD
jgi:hypothetical protein